MPVGQSQTKNHGDCLAYLQSLGDALPKEVADRLAAQILEETSKSDAGTVNQATLNVIFRVYYHIVHKYDLADEHFGNLHQQLSYDQTQAFLMLQAVMLTNHWSKLDANVIEAKCMDALINALHHHSSSLLHILKATNLLVKKFPKLELVALQLEHFYQCLQRQSQMGSREETLTLFNHCCKQKERAFLYFRIIVEFWPWTNRNKYYLLSGILNSYGLSELLAASGHNEAEFFSGLRLSLSYKGLRAASQYPVKSLSTQRSPGLLTLAVDLLVSGNTAEIQNFYSQWFLRIQQRDVLFRMLQAKPEIVEFLASTESIRSSREQLRLILIFSLFAKEIYMTSKLHFFKISTELLTNCNTLETDAQLLIFKFLVDNLANFAVEDCLDFFYNFMKRHRGVESSEFRNTMLGKMPSIINHTAKHFNKALRSDSGLGTDELANDIKRFFQQLQIMLEEDILCDVYQPKIFALKMLEILHKSLYSSQVSKNAKMCSTQQNQQLGSFLIDQGVFKPETVAQLLFKSLNDPQGFDDALELVVSLLLQLNLVDSARCIETCLSLCISSDVDECSLAWLYAQLAVRSCSDSKRTDSLYEQCLERLRGKLVDFQDDPLKTTKAGGHLFGHISVLNELVSADCRPIEAVIADLLPLVENILNVILMFLNLANARRDPTESVAASFQDMDESLQLLVSGSIFEVQDEGEDYLKYLLMTFWLTLKACCHLATSLGCRLLRSANSVCDYDALERCLEVNVAVLTRCRHKGAIESAGLSIGKLTRMITSSLASKDRGFQLLHECLERELLSDCRQVSTTRRGAGFSIMFLHVLKNDDPRERLLLHRAVQHIIDRLNRVAASDASSSNNLDRWEALALHYLCVLVRDTELRAAMCRYYNDIMLVAIAHIDNGEWTISNAALQLFGAMLGKLVGQRQATEFDSKLAWEPSEMNYAELASLLPKACEHMLNCCSSNKSTSSIILFLGFLSKVEDLRTTNQPPASMQLLRRFRRLSWRLLRHRCEQVRLLAATCFVRAHEFRCALPAVLLASAKTASQVHKDNFYEALLYTLHAGVLKLQHESRHVWPADRLLSYQQKLVTTLGVSEEVARFKVYTLRVLLRLLQLLEATPQASLVRQLLDARDGHALS